MSNPIFAHITTEHSRNIDADNVSYLVTLKLPTGENLEGYARLILSSNSFHADSELEALCERHGIFWSDLQNSLEERRDDVEMAKLQAYYQPKVEFLDKMGVSDYFVWETKQSCMTDTGLSEDKISGFSGDDIEDVVFVDRERSYTLGREEESFKLSQKDFDTALLCLKEQHLLSSPVVGKTYKIAINDFLSILAVVNGSGGLTGTVLYYHQDGSIIQEESLNNVSEVIEDIAFENPFKIGKFTFISDLSEVDKRNKAQITLDVEFDLETLILAGKTAEFMAESTKELIEFEVGDGILTSADPVVEVNEYSIVVNNPSIKAENPVNSTKGKQVYSVSEKAFKNSAKRLAKALGDEDFEINYNKSLQLLSQVVYTKPFEEVKATLFK